MATLITLVNFTGAVGSGGDSHATLIADSTGDLFGTTDIGGTGTYHEGTVFELLKTVSGYASAPTRLASFTGANGDTPGSLVADSAGNLFGATLYGGASNNGSVFEIAKTADGYAGAPITLVSFTGANGAVPSGSLLADTASDLFGTTAGGGANGDGTVFEVANTVSGYASAPITLATFNGANGSLPGAGLISDAAGDLFGTTQNGGTDGYGTVFEIAKIVGGYASAPTTLVSFTGDNGRYPGGNLIADAAGDLFGTAYGGGAGGVGTVFEIAKTADGFANAPTTLATFTGANGSFPTAGLIADAAGNLFGTTTAGGGAKDDGTVFEIAKTAGGFASVPTTLVTFTGGNGATPDCSLLADAAGNLFGTTNGGGTYNDQGTVFEITNSGFVPAGPVLTAPVSATITQGTATAIPGLSLEETGAVAGETFTVTLVDTNGLLSAAGAGISGSATASVTITGALAQVNADLATVTDTDYATAVDTIRLSATDSLGNIGPSQTIAVNVSVGSKTFIFTAGLDSFHGGYENDTFVAATNTLNRGDVAIGGNDVNVLELQGGGVFNLAAPTTLSGVSSVTAQEGVGAALQTIKLRDGLNVTLNAASGAAGAGIRITGANDASVINLGSGADTVTLGGAGETVHGGSGKDTFNVTGATIGATIDGGTGASTLVVTGGGTLAMGPRITNVKSVTLKSATTFTANGLALNITGSTGADTIQAGSGTQTITGAGGVDVLLAGAGVDTFKDKTANLVLDTIENFKTGDIIDITDLKFSKTVTTTAIWSNNVLTVVQGAITDRIALMGSFTGVFSASSDGKTGTDITYSGPPGVAAMAQAMAAIGDRGAVSRLWTNPADQTLRSMRVFMSSGTPR